MWGDIELGERVKNRREQDCGGGGWRGFILVRGHGSSCVLEALRWLRCQGLVPQCALLYKGWSGIVEWQGQRRRREGHEVNESVAEAVADRDCDTRRKMAGDCTISNADLQFPSTAPYVRSTCLRSHAKESPVDWLA